MKFRKYIIIIIALMTITILSVVYFSNFTSNEVFNAITNEFLNNMVKVSKGPAIIMQNDLNSIKRILVLTASTLKDHKYNTKDAGLVKDLNVIYNSMDFLSSNDLGYINENGTLEFNLFAPQIVGKNFSFRKYFKTVKEKQDPNFMEVEFIEFKGVSPGDKGLLFALGVYEMDESRGMQVFKGLVVITSTLNSFIERYLKPMPIGYGGYMWFFDSNGAILHHPYIFTGKTFEEIMNSSEHTKSFKQAMENILNGNQYTGKYIEEGDSFLYSARTIEAGDHFWYVVISVSEKETQTILERYSIVNLMLSLTAIAAVIIFGFFLVFVIYLRNKKLLQVVDINEYQLEVAKKGNEELASIIHTIAHDLKTPLSSIIGFSEVLMTEDVKDNNIKFLSRISSSANYMKALIDDLLELARIGSTSNIMEDISLKDIIREVEVQLHYVIEIKEATINVPEKLPVISADKLKVTQVFANLISNAIKFVPSSVKPVVDIGVNESDEFYDISITDNGIGMDEDELDKIFNLFYRVKTIDIEGTGVGLTIVKKIMEDHGGRVKIKSSRLSGTTVTVSFKKQHFA